ncbi:receptor-like serine/threonine-protein kinase SD1-8 [Tanacetum coccineum]
MPRGYGKKHKDDVFLLYNHSHNKYKGLNKDCQLGNPCEMKSDPRVDNHDPIIGNDQGLMLTGASNRNQGLEDTRIKSTKYTSDNSFTLGYTEAVVNVKILQSCNDYAHDDSNFYGCAGLRLAFDPTKSPNYKVVRNGRNSYEIVIQIYSLESGNWTLCRERFTYLFFVHFDSAIYWNDALHWLETENRRLTQYKLNIKDHKHPIITTIQISQDHEQPIITTMLPMIISIRIPHILHQEGKLFESLGCLVLVRRDCIGSSKFTIYEMRKGCSMWSKREDDSFLIINLSAKVVQYNLISKTLPEIYDMGSNAIADDYLHGFILPYAMYDVGYKKLDYKVDYILVMMSEEPNTNARETYAPPHKVLTNDDLLTEIFIRLHILCIHLFTCVSKQWLKILKSPAFTLKHSQIRSLDSPAGLFVNHFRSSFDCDFVSLDPRINSRKYTIENSFILGSAEEAGKVKILQSCNALLLCTGSRRHAFDYVYNPSTNLFKILPEPDYANDDSNFYGCAGLSAMYWNNALHWLETENSQLTHYKLNIEYHDHPIITTIQIPQSLQQGRNFFESYGNILPMIITIQIPHMLHLEGKLFDSRGCLLLVRRDDFRSSEFTIYEMMKGSSVWSVRYHVDTDDFMTPFPEG